MRVVPWDEHGDEAGVGEPEEDHARLNTMRSWLVSGIHVVDPRRRFGSHGRARELLVVERPARQEASERWQTLAAALHRHTVRDGLSQLKPDERRVITLAYLEGQSNREIAAELGVSVSTVRRRLGVALDHLDIYLRRTGAWLAAFLLATLAYANGQMTRAGRWAGAAAGSTDRGHLVAAVLAAGALGTAAVGMVALNSGPATPGTSPRVAVRPVTIQTAPPHAPVNSSGWLTAASSLLVAGGLGVAGVTEPGSGVAPSLGGVTSGNGCHGNPTSAAPPVPVGSHNHQPRGAPVTHPSVGGCKTR